MSERFVVWDPDMENEPLGDAAARNAVYAYDAEDAAEEYAEADWGNVDPYEKATFHVRDARGGLHVVEVSVDWSPRFYATERKP